MESDLSDIPSRYWGGGRGSGGGGGRGGGGEEISLASEQGDGNTVTGLGNTIISVMNTLENNFKQSYKIC